MKYQLKMAVRIDGQRQEAGAIVAIQDITGLEDYITEVSETSSGGESGKTDLVVSINEIVAAIDQLDSDNEEHFTKSGKPDIKVLETILKADINGKQRDDAWTAHQATKK